MEIMDYFMTESKAANILGVNRNTIARWVKQGKLDIQRIGRTGLIPKWQIELMRDNNRRGKDV